MQEEMMTHYKEGRYIVAYQEEGEGKEMMLLKQKDGQAFQPLFTDFLEFQKFQQFHGGKMKTGCSGGGKDTGYYDAGSRRSNGESFWCEPAA